MAKEIITDEVLIFSPLVLMLIIVIAIPFNESGKYFIVGCMFLWQLCMGFVGWRFYRRNKK